jgi:hypothetical protein
MNYREYITSTEWRDKHKHFLKRSHYRCAFFPWVRVGKRHRYNCHHMNYEKLGDETLWVDVVVVCPFVHNFILHGILSGFKRPSQQKSYPNLAQKTAHFWCCQPVMLRGALVITLLVNLIKLVWL